MATRYPGNDTNQTESTLKILFVGDAEVGKTSVIRSICGEDFRGTYSNTIGIDFKTLFYKVDDHMIKVQIWDTAGQERFHTITRAYYRGAHGIILVYDLTSEESFNHIQRWIKSIREEGPLHVLLSLMANKLDLDPLWRSVDKRQGETIADQLGMTFTEVSAKTGDNVQESFEKFVRDVKRNMDNMQEAKREDEGTIRPTVRDSNEPIPTPSSKCSC